MNTHQFKIELDWKLPLKTNNNHQRTYIKSHTIYIKDKPNLEVSAAKVFKGDPKLYNPEDLLLSSLTSCHMMSYLYCCAQNNIEVVSYSDESEAFLEVNSDGSGRITKVILNPIVYITDPNQIELANSLHKKANRLCFIANSCNFVVEHNGVCNVV